MRGDNGEGSSGVDTSAQSAKELPDEGKDHEKGLIIDEFKRAQAHNGNDLEI